MRCPSVTHLQPIDRNVVSKEKTDSRKIGSNNFMGEASMPTNYRDSELFEQLVE